MNAVLSSFCFETTKTDAVGAAEWSYGMPPVCFRSIGASFRPDYSICFLCDVFYVDELTIKRVAASPMFLEHRELFDALNDTGRLRVVDYRDIVAPYENLIDASFRSDLVDLSHWRDSFMELVDLWDEFIELAQQMERRHFPDYDFGKEKNLSEVVESVRSGMVRGILKWRVRESLRNWKKSLPEEDRAYTRQVVAPYLRHVSATLCLADCLDAVVHDWSDIGPIYRQKLTESARVLNLQDQDRQEKCRQLIRVMFPEFVPKSSKSLAKALDDSRIEKLRKLVNDAVLSGRDFDHEFAATTLREVLAKEQLIGKYRNIVGWLTMPLSVIPWVGTVVEKGAQVTIERMVERRMRQDTSWFLWLSEVNRPKDVVDAVRQSQKS